MNRHRRQGGQSLVLAALLIPALTGFVGLAVDGGEAANEQQIVRSAADGAALAGLYAIANGSATTAATTLAQQLLVAVPLPIADLTMSYLDAGGSPTIVTANVVTVRAVVADSHTTFFLRALGVPNLLLTATAEAKGGGSGGAAAACAVCLMGATGTTLSERNSASMTITGGPLNVNSNGVSAIDQDNGAALTAPSITVVGGVLKGTGTITPSPVTSSAAILDPFAAIPVPALVGAAANFTAPAGTSALAPGVYSTVTVNAGSTLTFSPGTFVILTELNVNRGAVNGGGVTLYLGCAAYPTPCAVGASGAFINVASGSLTLAPPAAGTPGLMPGSPSSPTVTTSQPIPLLRQQSRSPAPGTRFSNHSSMRPTPTRSVSASSSSRASPCPTPASSPPTDRRRPHTAPAPRPSG